MKRRLVAAFVVLAELVRPDPARAIFGEEDWLSGQNVLLSEILANQLRELTEITTLVANTRLIVASTNDALALARTLKRVYEVMRTYDLKTLAADAKQGLFRAMPELRQTEYEVEELVQNGRAIAQGEGAFFQHVTFHDSAVSHAARRSFEHGYQTTIWPMVFPDAMRFQPKPSGVELLVQERYRRTDDERRRAVQRTALGVLAQKVDALVQDSELKDNVELRTQAANAQVNYQSMANLTEIRNLSEQDAAEREAARIEDRALRGGLQHALQGNASILVTPPSGEGDAP